MEGDEIRVNKGNNLLYVCSPYRGEIQRNKAYARELTRAAVDSGFAPVAVHLYMTEALNDSNLQERSRGMEAGKYILEQCSFILVGDRYGISKGMKEEIRLADMCGIEFLHEKNGRLYRRADGGECSFNMMKKFRVNIVETYRRQVEVEAQDADEAYEEIDSRINEGLIDLPCDGEEYRYSRELFVKEGGA